MTPPVACCDFCEKPESRPVVTGRKGYSICRQCVDAATGLLGVRLPPSDHKPLTKKQANIYGYLAAFIAQHGYAPSFEEIAAAFSFASLATVHEHLQTLERKGWIKRAYNEARSIECLVTRQAA